MTFFSTLPQTCTKNSGRCGRVDEMPAWISSFALRSLSFPELGKWGYWSLLTSVQLAQRAAGTQTGTQSAVWWQQGWVHLSQYSHPSPLIALLLQGWKLPSKHPPPLPLRFALKFPIVCLLQSNACSLAQNYSNWFLLVLDRRCCEQGLLSRCGARASPVVEHGC